MIYDKPYLQAFRQALSLNSRRYKVHRQVTNHFDEKGRPDSKEQIEYVELAIVPSGELNIDQKEQGSWNAQSYSISYVYPEYLRGEDIIEHPEYGRLRVTNINDMREYGVSTATAVRIDSIRQIRNSGEFM